MFPPKIHGVRCRIQMVFGRKYALGERRKPSLVCTIHYMVGKTDMRLAEKKFPKYMVEYMAKISCYNIKRQNVEYIVNFENGQKYMAKYMASFWVFFN